MVKPSIQDQPLTVQMQASANPELNSKASRSHNQPKLPAHSMPACISPNLSTNMQPCKYPPTRAWIVCDALNDQLSFEKLASSHGIDCERILQSNIISSNISNILTEHLENPPQLVWIAIPKRYLPNLESQKQFVAVRLLLYQQLQSGGRIVVEGAATQPTSKGMYIPAEWYDSHDLRNSKVWWCQLGVNSSTCISENTVSNFALPSRYLSCCGQPGIKNKRGIKPKHTPTGQYVGMIKALREALTADIRQSSSESISFQYQSQEET